MTPPLAGLRLVTSHGTFSSPAPVSSTTTSLYGTINSDGALDPKTPPVALHLGEPVRFSLPAFRGAQPPLHYNALSLVYRNAVIDVDVGRPIWRPDKLGTYDLIVAMKGVQASRDSLMPMLGEGRQVDNVRRSSESRLRKGALTIPHRAPRQGSARTRLISLDVGALFLHATVRTQCDIFIYVMAKILSVSLPDELMRDTENLALAQGKTKSELVRDALRRQIQLGQLRELQRDGRRLAERRGIGPEDVEALVDEFRGGQG
jgi:Ribbon-helix-helix protein, copG family